MHTIKSVELFEIETKTTPASFILELRMRLDIFIVVVNRLSTERVQNSQFVSAYHTSAVIYEEQISKQIN